MQPNILDFDADLLFKRIFSSQQACMADLILEGWAAYYRARLTEQGAPGALPLTEWQGEARAFVRGFIRGYEQGLAEELRPRVENFCELIELLAIPLARRRAAIEALASEQIKPRLERDRRRD